MPKIDIIKIKWDKIRDILNSGGGKVTNELRTGFLDSAKYNKWARWKPRKYKADFVPMGDASASPQSWRASDGRCGLSLPLYNKLQDVKGKNFVDSWLRNPPTGGITEPLRIDDYGGYNSDARHPIAFFRRDGDINDNVHYFNVDPPSEDPDYIPLALGVRCGLNDNRIGTPNDDSLDLTDFRFNNNTFIEDLYYGLIISKDDSNFCSYVTMKESIKSLSEKDPSNILYPYSNTGMYIPITFDSFRLNINTDVPTFAGVGKYSIYPCIFFDYNYNDVRGSDQNITIANGFLPLPVNPIFINVIQITDYISVKIINAVRNTSLSDNNGTVLDITLEITNNNSNAEYTFSGDNGSLNYIKAGIAKYQGDNNIIWSDKSSSPSFILPAESSLITKVTTPYTSNVPYTDKIAEAYVEVTFMSQPINKSALSQNW